LFRKHAIELSGLLRYMFWQLSLRNTFDLVVMQELVGQMSGVKPVDEATESQLDALAGGETLKREAFFFENVRFVRKGITRLVKSLLDTGLTLPFAVMLGQLRKECIFVNDSTELKVLGWMQDNVSEYFWSLIFFYLIVLWKDKAITP
jgi:THO complex subunit 2